MQINRGFVTDSNTEKELQEWQQARENPINEAQLRQRHQNRLNNAQGQHFEREIIAGCRMYEQHKIAVIDKTPEPFRVTKKHQNGLFTGRFNTPAQPDFQGTLRGGQSIVFEAKKTSRDRITRNVLTDTQMEVLEKHNRLGALCGVYRYPGQLFLYPLECMAGYERNVRQTVPKARGYRRIQGEV